MSYANDSLASKFLPRIISAKSEQEKIQVMLKYGEALLPLNPEKAKEVYENIYLQSKQAGDDQGRFESLLALAKIAYKSGRNETSDSLYLLVLSGKKVKPKYLFKAFVGIGNSFTIKGDYELAADYYYKALTISEKDSSIQKAYLYGNLFVVWLNIGDEEKAMFYLEEGEKQAVLEKDSVQLSTIWNRQANQYLEKDTALAYRKYEQSIALSIQLKDSVTRFFTSFNLAYLNAVSGNTAKAYEYIAFCNYVLRNDLIKDVFQKLSSLYYLGGCYLALKDYQLAESTWLSCIQEASAFGANIYRVKPYFALAELYSKQGKYQKANKYYVAFSNLNDTLINEEKLNEINRYEKQYRTAQLERIAKANQLVQMKSELSIERRNRLILFLVISGVVALIFLVFYRMNSMKKYKVKKEKLLLTKKEAQLKRLKIAVKGESDERKRIAGDLHDGVGSLLSVAKMNSSLFPSLCTELNNDLNFQYTIQLLDQSTENIRAISHCLVPETLLKGGLNEALQILCHSNSEIFKSEINFQTYGNYPEINPKLEEKIFRIIQDLIMQTLNDSNGNKILIQLNWQMNVLFVTMDVNGEPLNAQKLNGQWDIIKQKVKDLKGVIEIRGEINGGSIIDLEISIY